MGITPPENASLHDLVQQVAPTKGIVHYCLFVNPIASLFLNSIILHWQFCVPPLPHTRTIYQHADIRSHDGHVPREGPDRAEEVAKEHHDAV